MNFKNLVKVTLILIVLLFVMFSLSSCVRTIEEPCDELTVSSWSQAFDNGNTVTLSFYGDNAKLSLKTKENSLSTVIDGFCEIDNWGFVIHDKATKTPYYFEYTVRLNEADIAYEGSKITLKKIEN